MRHGIGVQHHQKVSTKMPQQRGISEFRYAALATYIGFHDMGKGARPVAYPDATVCEAKATQKFFPPITR